MSRNNIQNQFYFLLSIVLLVTACAQSSKNKNGSGSGESLLGNSAVELPKLVVHKKILSNGLTVLVHENDQLPIFSYYTFFDVGGRYESRKEGTTGATHFLEHMMFKGAKKYTEGQFDTLLEGLGGSTNAYTTFDSTVYYESLPTSGLELIIDMEADRLTHLALNNESFEKERQVIFEERRMRYENSPQGKMFLSTMQEVFKGTPYGGSVIGEEIDLKNLTRDHVFNFFKTFYSPNNAIVVVVGDVKASKVFQLIEEKYGQLQKNVDLEKLKQSKDKQEIYAATGNNFGRTVKLKGTNPLPLFSFVYPGDPIGTRRAFVMDFVSSILGDGVSSYFHQKYVKNERPVLSSIDVSNMNKKFAGAFLISGELLKSTNVNEFEKSFRKDMKSFCKDAINDRSLQKAKNQFFISYMGEMGTNDSLAGFLGLRESLFNDYSYFQKEMEIYASIGKQEVVETCESIFLKQKPLLMVMTN